MNIDMSDGKPLFWQLEYGDVFSLGTSSELWMRIQSGASGTPNAIRLSDGRLERFDLNRAVTLRCVKVVREEANNAGK